MSCCHNLLLCEADSKLHLKLVNICLWYAGKLLAFSGPSNVARVYYGFKSFTPDDYCDYFKQRGVTAVVRLNKPVSSLDFCSALCRHIFSASAC